MATRIFCDKCKEEIKGDNVGKLNHQTEWNEYVVSVEAEDEFGNKPDLCLDCLLEIVTAKPKRKYERRAKVLEPIVGNGGEALEAHYTDELKPEQIAEISEESKRE